MRRKTKTIRIINVESLIVAHQFLVHINKSEQLPKNIYSLYYNKIYEYNSIQYIRLCSVIQVRYSLKIYVLGFDIYYMFSYLRVSSVYNFNI